jgi:hypothetical protein
MLSDSVEHRGRAKEAKRRAQSFRLKEVLRDAETGRDGDAAIRARGRRGEDTD